MTNTTAAAKATQEEGTGPITQEDFFNTYFTEIENAARRETGSRHYLDADDVTQAIAEAVLTEWEYFKGRTLKEVRAMFRRRARQFITKEVADYQHFTAAFIYTPAEVRNTLANGAWNDVTEAPDIEARADITRAWKQLNPSMQKAVYKRHGLGIPVSEMTAAESRAADRGVDEIARILNSGTPAAEAYEENE